MGFGADIKKKTELKAEDSLFKQVMPEDLMKFGLIPEFAGRLPVMVSLDALDKEAIEGIMRDVMYEVPSRTDVVKCIVTEDTVRKHVEPELIVA